MRKKLAYLAILAVIFAGVFSLAANVQRAEASGGFTIRADGSIYPPASNVTTIDNVTYTLTGSVRGTVTVERDNIVIAGGGYEIIGAGDASGVRLRFRKNITIKNLRVTNFNYGIYLESTNNSVLVGNTASKNDESGFCLKSSNNNTLSNNTASSNDFGFLLGASSNNTLSSSTASSNNDGFKIVYSNNSIFTGNTASNNSFDGIDVDSSGNNTFIGNTALNNTDGFHLLRSSDNTFADNVASNNNYGFNLWYSHNNTLIGNTISSNSQCGIRFVTSSDNVFFHNNFVGNTMQAWGIERANVWDDGYPSGGNYWSDYEEKYPDAAEVGSSGIWDTPYVISEDNTDHYPLIPEFPPFLITPLLMITTLLAVVVTRRRHSM